MSLSLQQSKRYLLPVMVVGVIALLIIGGLVYKSNFKDKREISRQEFISELPYFTEEFTINYSPNKDQIYVNVLKEPYEENRQKALQWIKDNRANPQSLKIIYTPANKFKTNQP